MAILFVSGINDRAKIGVTLDQQGKLINLMDGNCSIHRRIPLKEGLAGYAILFGHGVKQERFNFIHTPSLIFNQISDADTHRGSLERCIELCSLVNSPVINHPELVLQTTRDRVSERLQDIPGVTMPRTIRFNPASPDDVYERAEADDFGLPFIVRVAGLHGGESMIRVKGPGDYGNLHAFPFDGRDYYLSEYVDCRDNDGFYHRQRLVVIDGEPVLRGSLYDKDWKVHGASRYFMLERESWDDDHTRSAMLESEIIPSLEPAITEITKRMKLEFFGIDCNLGPEGEMLIFEANANMNILTNDHVELNDRMEMITRKIQAMLVRYSGEQVI